MLKPIRATYKEWRRKMVAAIRQERRNGYAPNRRATVTRAWRALELRERRRWFAQQWYWVYCEDFVSALVGPFYSLAEAEAHVKFIRKRGDSGIIRAVGAAEAEALKAKWSPMLVSVAKDLAYNPMGE